MKLAIGNASPAYTEECTGRSAKKVVGDDRPTRRFGLDSFDASGGFLCGCGLDRSLQGNDD